MVFVLLQLFEIPFCFILFFFLHKCLSLQTIESIVCILIEYTQLLLRLIQKFMAYCFEFIILFRFFCSVRLYFFLFFFIKFYFVLYRILVINSIMLNKDMRRYDVIVIQTKRRSIAIKPNKK